MRNLLVPALVFVMTAAAGADVAVEHWTTDAVASAHKGGLTIKPAAKDGKTDDESDQGPWVIQADLSSLPAGTQVLSARLVAARKPVDGVSDFANQPIEIHPLLAPLGDPPKLAEKPLPLLAPWYDSFDLTDTVRGWVKDAKANHGLYVKSFPLWLRERTRLEVTWTGKAAAQLPPQVTGLKALHRAGQTFLTWNGLKKFDKDDVTWGELKSAMEELEAAPPVRYRVYRHGEPITAANLDKAQLLAEVLPLCEYNIHGRSVDELIAQVRRRAMADYDLAKKLATTGYFGRYNPDMPEMAQVRISRLAIEDGKPLPAGTGLYVHAPADAGKACYAVVAETGGVANCRDFSPANALSAALDEQTGPGQPVLQGEAKVTVFFDYPGQRYQYVQWAGPPLANVPNQYYNWGVFVPRDYEQAKVKPRRAGVAFHDSQQRFLKPAWPHRRDTVLLSPHDYPYKSFGYGYHEALGTLRSFGEGKVQPFFGRRVDAMLDWAVRKFGADATTVSCGGSGYWGGTAALQYGLRRFGKIAYVLADSSPDADPRQMTDFEQDGRKSKGPRLAIDASWGKLEWSCKADTGKNIWDEANLPAFIKECKTPVPYLTLGAGSQHATWPQEADLMKAFMESRNGFMAEFWWGSTPFLPLPVSEDAGTPFEPRTNQPILACWPKVSDVNAKFYEDNFLGRKRGYNSGSRFNTKPRWRPDDLVDTPEKLEMTIFAGNVAYAGAETTEVTIRNCQQFKPAAGAKLTWKLVGAKDAKLTGGEMVVNEAGMIVIPQLTFGAPARLVVEKAR